MFLSYFEKKKSQNNSATLQASYYDSISIYRCLIVRTKRSWECWQGAPREKFRLFLALGDNAKLLLMTDRGDAIFLDGCLGVLDVEDTPWPVVDPGL